MLLKINECWQRMSCLDGDGEEKRKGWMVEEVAPFYKRVWEGELGEGGVWCWVGGGHGSADWGGE